MSNRAEQLQYKVNNVIVEVQLKSCKLSTMHSTMVLNKNNT